MDRSGEATALALDVLDVGIGIFDRSLDLLMCNQAFRTLRDYPASLCRPGVNLAALLEFNARRGDFGPGDPAALAASRMAEIRRVEGREVEREMAGGRILAIHYRGTVTGELVISLRDRTAEHRAQSALRTSEERHSLVTRATSDGIYDWNVGEDLLYVSDNLTRIVQFDLDEKGSRRWLQSIHPDDAATYVEAIRDHFRGATDAVECEYRLRAPDGTYRWVHDRGVGTRGEEGRIVRLVGAVRDITEARAAQARFDAAIEAISSGVALWDASDRLVACNRRYRDYFSGFIADLVPGAVFSDIIREACEAGAFPDAAGNVEGFMEGVLRKRAGASGEVREQHLRGDLWLQISDHRMDDGGIVSIYTDVSRRKRDEQALQQAVREFDAVLENIDYGVAFMGPDLRARIVNRAFCRMWGIPQSFMDGKPTMRELIEFNRRNGVYPVADEDWEPWAAERVAAVTRGNIDPIELVRADGVVLVYRCVALADGGRMLTYFDITELKRRERQLEAAKEEAERALEDLRQAQQRLVQSEKLASLGQLTAGIAHEIKNPLHFINNFSRTSIDLLEELDEVVRGTGAALPDEAGAIMEDLKEDLGSIAEHGRRADSIVKGMLMHSRSEGGGRQRVGLNGLLTEGVNLAYHGQRAADPDFNVTFELDLDDAVGELDLFPQEITRVVLNLLGNAFYAVRKRQSVEVDGYSPGVSVTSRPGERGGAVVVIRDNGTGIPHETLGKLFAPFFTTKPPGEGTGLGLSISHDIIVGQHGGALRARSVPGEFTEFEIELPGRTSS